VKHSELSPLSNFYFYFIIFFPTALISLSQKTTDTKNIYSRLKTKYMVYMKGKEVDGQREEKDMVKEKTTRKNPYSIMASP
jgi:hypothetical protein